VLAAYFVCVVPINFLVLRKLKRGELAWITAPIISLAFAGMLFRSAGSLYKAGMSTVTSGVVVAQDGSPEAMFIGGTQMFVPRAGSYDLKLKNVDSLGFVPDQEPWRGGGMRSGDDSASFASIDDGEIEVPGMSTNNLTFRRLTYRQRVPISSWFHVQLSPAGETTARCEVTNSSSFTLRNAQIDVGANSLPIGDLPPGKKLAMTVSLARDGGTPANDQSDIHMFTLNKSRVALTGQLDGFRPGPQIGESIPGRSEIDFAMFSSWEGGAR